MILLIRPSYPQVALYKIFVGEIIFDMDTEEWAKQYELLNDFYNYVIEHPEERFWQAIRNWSGYNFIYGSMQGVQSDGLHDTFYDTVKKVGRPKRNKPIL